jgi:hypothetical protein
VKALSLSRCVGEARKREHLNLVPRRDAACPDDRDRRVRRGGVRFARVAIQVQFATDWSQLTA